MKTKEIAGLNGETFIQTAEEPFLFQSFFNLFFLHPPRLIIMSCPVESDLRRYEAEQDQLHAEYLEREQNPVYYWHIVTAKDWDDYAYSPEEKDQMIAEAKRHGLKFTCTKHIEGESYA